MKKLIVFTAFCIIIYTLFGCTERSQVPDSNQNNQSKTTLTIAEVPASKVAKPYLSGKRSIKVLEDDGTWQSKTRQSVSLINEAKNKVIANPEKCIVLYVGNYDKTYLTMDLKNSDDNKKDVEVRFATSEEQDAHKQQYPNPKEGDVLTMEK